MIFEHKLTHVKIADLQFDQTNPNQMNQEQMAGLRKAMERFGYLSPIIVDQNNQIADGEHRVLVYKEFNLTEIPCYRVTFSDDSERRLLRQTMNKLRGQHDFAMDADEMALIYESQKLPDLSSLIAQQETTLKELMLKYRPELPFGHEDDQQLDELIDEQLKKTAPDTQLGDIYQLGNHRLICADCTDKRSLDRLLEGKMMDMVFTDPPYAIFGSSTGMKKDVADINMIKPFFRVAGEIIALVIKQMGHAYVMCDWRSVGTVSEEIGRFLQIKNVIVWQKPEAGYQGSFYSNNYENIALFVKEVETISMYESYRNKGQPKHRPIYDSNVWQERPVPIKEREHFAAKPISIAKKAIENSSDKKQAVFDPFLGSGSTLIACEQTGRICYGVEIDPHYVDVCVKRWENYTSNKAVRLNY